MREATGEGGGAWGTFVPHLDVLPDPQRTIWPLLASVPEGFVLYGGTALALRLGHRSSADFDLFSASTFLPTELVASLDWLRDATIDEAAPDRLVASTSGGVNLSFFGGLRLQVVAEPAVPTASGLVVASLADLAGTKAKAILDRSEWKDYVDIAALLRTGMTLPQIIGFATTIFEPSFVFPAAVFLRALTWFGDGTAGEVDGDTRKILEQAAVEALDAPIPRVEPFLRRIP